MRQIVDKIQFVQGRLNSDVDVELMPKGDSPVDPSQQNSGRLNLAHLDGNLGVLSTLKGSTQISISGIFYVSIMGSKYYEEDNSLIVFLNDFSRGVIVKISNSGVVSVIYNATSVGGQSLNFTTDVIKNIIIIGSGDDAQLIWISKVNPPRCINIAQIIANPTTTPIDLALDSPVTLPGVTIGSDTLIGTNNLYNKGYQFSIKYVYFDGKESSWSDWTEPVYPAFVYEGYNGVANNNLTAYNKLIITHTGIPIGVVSVKIAYRYVDIGNGVAGAWYLYDTVDVVGSSITYDFYDNKIKTPVDVDDIFTQYYDVPLYGSDIQILKDNKLAISDPVLGYDNVDINISLVTLYKEISQQVIYSNSYYIYDGTSQNVSISLTANTSVIFIFYLDEGATANSFHVVINVGDINNDYSYQLAKAVNESALNVGVTATRMSKNVVRFTTSAIYDTTVRQLVIRNSSLRNKSQKTGAIHYFALAYTYDNKNRKGRANISSSSYISIPYWPDLNLPLTYDGYHIAVGYEIINTAPTGATAWELLYGGSNIAAYYSLPVVCNSVDSGDIADITYDGGFIYIDVNAADNRILAENTKYSTLITFDARKGDRVRFKAKGYREIGSLIDDMDLFTNNIDLEIIDVDENGVIKIESNVVDEISNELNDIIGDGSYDVITIEVYRIDKEISADNLEYVSIGHKGIVSGGYHYHDSESGTWYRNSDQTVFTPRNQTASLSCRGIVICDNFHLFGNMYPMYQSGDIKTMSLVRSGIETNKASLSYNSRYQGGKVNYVDSQAKQRTIRGVKFGGAYSEDGLIYNELNKFMPDTDLVDLTDSYGDVCGLELVGFTLKAFQQSKVTSIGNRVNENFNADGTSYQVAINETLGEPRQMIDDYGTVFSKSIVKKDSYVYFYDIHNYCPVRNAPNGNQEITYGMSNFWKARSKALLASGISNLKVHAVYDYILDMYVLTVIDNANSSNSFTLGFCEANSRWGNTLPGWYSFFSYLPDGYANMSRNRMFFWKNNIFHEMHVNSVRNNFLTEQSSSYITIVSNEALGIMKVFESIWINSNSSLWESPNNTDIIIHEDGGTYRDQDGRTRHKIKMQSRLKSTLFKPIEGMFKAGYLKNLISSSSTPKQSDLYRGDVLRGRYLKQTLRNTATTGVHLRDVTIISSASEGN